MADTFTHGAATGWAAKGIGALYLAFTGDVLFDPWWITVAVLGATLPDIISEPFIWYERHRVFGNERPWYKSLSYDGTLTMELGELERRETNVLAFWHWCHSYLCVALAAMFIWCLFGTYLTTAWLAGHTLHIMLDEWMHRKMYGFFPLLSYNTSRTETNWWDWGWWGRVYFLSVPAAAGGIWHILELHQVL